MNTSNFANTGAGANKMKHHIIPAPPKMDTSDQGFFLDQHNRPMPIIMVSASSAPVFPSSSLEVFYSSIFEGFKRKFFFERL